MRTWLDLCLQSGDALGHADAFAQQLKIDVEHAKISRVFLCPNFGVKSCGSEETVLEVAS